MIKPSTKCQTAWIRLRVSPRIIRGKTVCLCQKHVEGTVRGWDSCFKKYVLILFRCSLFEECSRNYDIYVASNKENNYKRSFLNIFPWPLNFVPCVNACLQCPSKSWFKLKKDNFPFLTCVVLKLSLPTTWTIVLSQVLPTARSNLLSVSRCVKTWGF